MPEHVWSVLCERGIVDQFTNRVSIFNVIETGTLPHDGPIGAPVLISGMLVSLWMRSDPERPEAATFRTGLRVPTGTTIVAGGILQIDLRTSPWFRAFAHIPSIPFHGFGVYRIMVEYQRESDSAWKEVAAIPLVLIPSPPPESAAVAKKLPSARRPKRKKRR